MGMFDSIMVPCPECGKKYEAQTKTGQRLLETWDLEDAPIEALMGVNTHAPFTCSCGTEFEVKFKVQVVYAIPVKVRKVDKE